MTELEKIQKIGTNTGIKMGDGGGTYTLHRIMKPTYCKKIKPVLQILNGVLGCHRMPEELKSIILKSEI